MLASRPLAPSVASTMKSTMSASSMFLRAMTTESLDRNDRRASALVGIACDVGVEAAGAFGGVDHEEHDVGVFDVLARHDHRKFLGHQTRLAFAADPGRVDEANLAAFVLDDFVDGIPRSAGNG